MKFTILASGSGGNVTFLENDGTKLLIDCGITHRQIVQRLHGRDHDLDELDAVLITHEHGDHIKGLDVVLRKTGATCHLTADTYQSISPRDRANYDSDRIRFVVPFETFQIGTITITPISISHDAADAVGYILEADGKKLVYVTDIGYLPKRDHALFANADVYIFESNYDVTMLFTSERPFYLKQRIDSVKGHMSNADSAYNLAQLVGDRTKQIILAHRSRECNTDELVLATYREVFAEYGLNADDYNLVVAHQDIPTPVFHI